jgi:hypothetical protein
MTPAFAYAGIGSRRAKDKITNAMEAAGEALASLGLTLRSGGAHGCDRAFERGCDRVLGPKEIYIPWGGFNNRSVHERGVIGKEMRHYHTAERLARRYHPAWLKLTPAMKQLITRNSYQILPCLFVLCWTPSGLGQGGTGQAIRIAKAHDIPVFDMANMDLGDINQEIMTIIQKYEEAA